MEQYDIQPVSSEDLNYLSKIMQQRWSVSSEWADAEAKKYLSQDANAAGFCVHYKGKTIGIGLFDFKNDDVSTLYGPWLYLLWVDPEFRGHDLGIELTKRRMEHARSHGYMEVYLDTADAPKYHRNLGWEDVCMVQYKGEDDWIMRYDLSKDFPQIYNKESW